MKVYLFEGRMRFGGGRAVVSAETVDEARNLIFASNDFATKRGMDRELIFLQWSRQTV